MRQLLLIFLLITMVSCGESEQLNTKKAQVEKDFPLLGFDVPSVLIKQVLFIEGECKEASNLYQFQFENEEEWYWQHFDRNTGKVREGAFGAIWWQKDLPKDRYDRTLPPNECMISNFDELGSRDFIESSAICYRDVIGDDYSSDGSRVRVRKKSDAICSVKVVNRLDCLPDHHFDEDPRVGLDSNWRKEHQHEACSSPTLAQYKLETLKKWEAVRSSFENKEKSQ